MNDLKRTKITAPAIPVRGNDIDTDRIIPARFLKCVTFDGLGEHAFEDDRLQLKQKGQTHPIDNPKFANAKIMLANKNFGCGSSREHAVWALRGAGVSAVIASSFSRIFYRNAINNGFLIIECPEASAVNPNDWLWIDPAAGIIRNQTQGTEYRFVPLSTFAQELLAAGGLLPYVVARKSQAEKTRAEEIGLGARG